MKDNAHSSNSVQITIPVAILLQHVKIFDNFWITHQWKAIGVIPAKNTDKKSNDVALLSNIDDEPIYQYNGFQLKIIHDELDSYYQNISSDYASIFIVCHDDDDHNPKPFLVTLSYDEAAIYMETDELVYAVGIDIKIYQTIEKFVLEHYRPEQGKKRRLVKGTAGEHYKKMSIYE